MAWHKTSRHERGYGAEWDRIRKQILERDNYICHCPQCRGGVLRVTSANEVDHIITKAKGGTDDPENLRAVNHDCHKRLTIEQQGKTYKPKVSIGIDGWPT